MRTQRGSGEGLACYCAKVGPNQEGKMIRDSCSTSSRSSALACSVGISCTTSSVMHQTAPAAEGPAAAAPACVCSTHLGDRCICKQACRPRVLPCVCTPSTHPHTQVTGHECQLHRSCL